MNIVYTVRSDSPQASLAQLLHLPLGLDVWQVKADHVVLRADEAQAARLRQIGYTTEELVETETHISMFATAEAIAAYHSAETLEDDLRQLAESQPEIAELRRSGVAWRNARSGRCESGSDAPRSTSCCSWVAIMPANG